VVFTSEASRTAAVSPIRPAPGQQASSGRTLLPRPGDLAQPLTLAQGVEHAGQPFVVMESAAQGAQQEAVATTGGLLLAGVPLLMALTGLVTWWLVGRALCSVELIRTQVERIGASRLSERVPVPGGRDEIAHLASTMNAMLTRLETSHSTQRRFVADASHELRSPLATLAASLEVGQADQSEQTWRDLMPILQAETQRMRHLVDDLLLLSKVDDRGLPVFHADVDLDDLVDQESRRLRGLGQVRVTTRATPTRVAGDEHKLAQVIRNLADNAVRAARAEVRLSVQADDGGALITVEDDGPGIPVQDRHRVFDRFVRLDESRSRESGGSGLGLSIAHEIVRAHGGELAVGDSDLGGARLTARLPLPVRSPSPDRGSGPTRESGQTWSSSGRRGCTEVPRPGPQPEGLPRQGSQGCGRQDDGSQRPSAEDVGQPVVAEVDAAQPDRDADDEPAAHHRRPHPKRPRSGQHQRRDEPEEHCRVQGVPGREREARIRWTQHQ